LEGGVRFAPAVAYNRVLFRQRFEHDPPDLAGSLGVLHRLPQHHVAKVSDSQGLIGCVGILLSLPLFVLALQGPDWNVLLGAG
jgi:hypothetical protein